ncbi:hypothetical protein HRI_000822300 [Hibiscus trionum]|uniref:Retroviral polymerase SH3-like domain-containing protein n=1 Tax=Hibiscus trionum TaxID=183268 RepID=A0A9W7H8Z7_HIBTR|nr:hypothetical protein HRI_000822300 [Hibiscus trionum]
MTPNDAWSDKKPGIGHLKIFGCNAYAHVPEQIRKKLDERGEQCIFIGYDERSKAYRLYNPVTKKLIISRDVEFDEAEHWRWSTEKKKVDGLFSNKIKMMTTSSTKMNKVMIKVLNKI